MKADLPANCIVVDSDCVFMKARSRETVNQWWMHAWIMNLVIVLLLRRRQTATQLAQLQQLQVTFAIQWSFIIRYLH